MAHYEIGMVYRKGENFYLAVGRQRILTGNRGRVKAVDCTDRFERAKSVSVSLLCRAWGISTSELDTITRSYLSPEPTLDFPDTTLDALDFYDDMEWDDEPASFMLAS